MFQLMRNTHLVLGLVFVLFSLMFAVSSLKFVYRDWFPGGPVEQEQIVEVDPAKASTPRALARELMSALDFAGELRRTEQNDDAVEIRIVRPGTELQAVYTPATGQAVVKHRRHDFFQALVQLHVNHGLWHDYWPAQVWSLLTFLASLGLVLLGGTGVYLWFLHHDERVLGGAILTLGLVWGLVTLYLCRV